MAYYRLPFHLDLIEESIQTNGNIVFKHPRCKFSLRCNKLNDEIVLSQFHGHFCAPTQLDTPDTAEYDSVTIMLNLGNAVYYHIHSLSEPRILPSNTIALCYSDARTGLCRYQPQATQMFALQIPRQVILEYLDVMQIGQKTQRQLKNREPFIIIKPATAQFLRFSVRLSMAIDQCDSIHRHLSYSFMSDATRYLIEDNAYPQQVDNSNSLGKAIDILDKEFITPPTITQLAHRIGTNENSLKQWFRKELNTTIHQYIVQQRMAKAAELLNFSTLNISHIAQEVGYANHGHFSAAFKREFGCPPSAYLSLRKESPNRMTLPNQ
ncbi:helix-turn-helix transcriptional regulator [Photobacterium sp. TY1-4]|uniref:helix-turn-helix transcriptional regulator n=1 Tax=Photobacterium sp. TY1-4 TaxID=2899122 RepID=UPI0021BF1891|nr:helix-turn-helix transcriptional regulator [Photobacterium sp. TY1-4]UXI03611.1 helix-turn-helix transcriptional regulator [Photobacterium sp. TY1-4]